MSAIRQNFFDKRQMANDGVSQLNGTASPNRYICQHNTRTVQYLGDYYRDILQRQFRGRGSCILRTNLRQDVLSSEVSSGASLHNGVVRRVTVSFKVTDVRAGTRGLW